MARELCIVWLSRHRRRAWEELCADYRKRIERFVEIRERPIKPRTAGDESTQLKWEGEQVLAALPDPGWTIALDRRGKMLDSVELSRDLQRLFEEWPHPVTLVIGSDLGLDRAVLERARWRWSLGPLTLPHELARLLLYEQLYRALTIEAGIRYHRAPLD